MTERHRHPHAAKDAAGRLKKARKIEAIVSRRRPLAGARVLEVGCGSGFVIAHLAKQAGVDGEGVDVVDERVVSDGYSFTPVDGTALPFADGSFDLVVSNHVVEHVGDREAQQAHLREVARVLTGAGILYLATPNKWAVREPHYNLPFLSWCPQTIADRYVRVTGRGDWYDVNPPRPKYLAAMLAEAGLQVDDATAEAALLFVELEASGVRRVPLRIASMAVNRLPRLAPTQVYVATMPQAR